MRIKKTAIAMMIFSAIAMVAGVKFAGAQAYTPLVQIPGVPAGAVNLSMYLVGLYDFLLSIVGIVAVMMLIIGGMRYITAAGNQAAISDAKDIITNALAGLLLAIFSWVIVAEINPDVLYIKKPGSDFVDTPSQNLGSCGVWNSTTLTCVCIDGSSPAGPFISAKDCSDTCKNLGYCNLPEPYPCIENGTPNDDSNGELTNKYEGLCQCIDGEEVEPAAGVDCQTTCLNPANYHCLVADAKIGYLPGGMLSNWEKYAAHDAPAENPITLIQDYNYLLTMRTTISGHTIVTQECDLDGDGNFERNIPIDDFTFVTPIFVAYEIWDSCESSSLPDLVVCEFLCRVEDDQTNESLDSIFVKVYRP